MYTVSCMAHGDQLELCKKRALTAALCAVLFAQW
jgi:hypothetical protein